MEGGKVGEKRGRGGRGEGIVGGSDFIGLSHADVAVFQSNRDEEAPKRSEFSIPVELILRLRVAMQDMGEIAGKEASQTHIVAPMMEFFDLTDGLVPIREMQIDAGCGHPYSSLIEWDKEGQK